MSEASITYQGEGERCGIFNVLNSELKNHEVCDDGLACIYTDIGDDVVRKSCKSIEVIEGERCIPTYDMCFSNLECLKNVEGDYTCGGVVPWVGNPEYIKTGYLKASNYCINIPMVIVGSFLLFFYLLLIIYELFIRSEKDNRIKSIYLKSFGSLKNKDGWFFNIFR